MRRPTLFWGGTLGALAALDYWCAKNATAGDSLSEVTRATFRTNTPLGRIALCVAWGGLTAAVLPHWMRVVDDALAEID